MKGKLSRKNLLLAATVPAAAVIVAVAVSYHPSGAAGAGNGTVTYVVTGSPADVTYGPAGSDIATGSPMAVTRKLSHPAYYAVTAQLRGSGAVRCQIQVNGQVVARGQASGGYGIARCEISQDTGGNWVSDAG